ncbi:MAG: hypothetical protein ACK56F_23355, partial [bacterium]
MGGVLKKAGASRGQVLYLRPRAAGCLRHHPPFRFLLEGRQFQLLTDHKPLVAAMTRVSPPQSARQQRHLAYISEFTTD